jgi:Ca2+-binding RTX toxin-like protein
LSASNNLADVDGPLLLAVSYQWQSSANNGVSWSNIAGANASTYSVNVPQGALLRVRASYSDSNGTAEIVDSAATSVVAGALVEGSASADNLVGTSGNDEILGLGGNDTLDGGLGADTLRGGFGDDSYTVDNPSDLVVEDLNAGTDTVNSTVTYTLPTNVEILELFGDQPISGTGNALTNHISGWRNPAANVLTGGTGSDWYYIGAGDTIVELANQGTDTASITVDFTLPSNVENLVFNALVGTPSRGTGNALNNSLTGGIGNDLLEGLGGNDTLTGGAGNDTLDGGTGNDSMVGGAGNDTYIVGSAGDIITESANQGTDLVQSSVTWTLGANLENLTLTGTSAINGTGNSLNNVVTGNSANNQLLGGAGNDTLVGGAGVDTLIGGAGVDRLTGGTGNDIFRYTASSESRTGVDLRDIITDFFNGADRLDLSAIDANTGVAGDQAFTLRPTAGAAFTGAGQIRFTVVGADTVIQGNTDGNTSTVEFEVLIQNSTRAWVTADLIP